MVEDDYYSDRDFWETEEGIDRYFVVFFSLLSLVLVLSKFLHDSPRIASILPEAGMIIILGTIAGAIIHAITPLEDYYEGEFGDDDELDGSINKFVAEGLLSFSPKVFFFILLPPIIFNSGYTLKRDVFFRHIGPISLFACVGTAISTLVVAILLQIVKILGYTGDFEPHFIELLTFGSLISATDPVSTLAVFQAKKVDPQLFYLVFGESVLNDAVGLVLFKTLSKFVGKQINFGQTFTATSSFFLEFSVGFIGSMVLGICAGLFSGYFLKMVDMRHAPLLELSLFFLIMYMPFFYAELLELSGIVTILFTGISARRYATGNLSESTEHHADILFRLAAHIAETSIFLELGLSVFGLSSTIQWEFIGWSILACLIGRTYNIYPLTTLYNLFLLKNVPEETDTDDCDASIFSDTPIVKKDLKIRSNTAHMLWFSGLRGAVAYACAKTFPNIYGNRATFVSTTMAIVFFTVFLFGCTTECALQILNIEMNCDEEQYMKENNTINKMNYINKFENKYIYPNVVRNFATNHEQDVEMDNKSAVTDPMDCVKSAPYQNFEGGKSVNTRKIQNRSLYDFGLGSSSSVMSSQVDTRDHVRRMLV